MLRDDQTERGEWPENVDRTKTLGANKSLDAKFENVRPRLLAGSPLMYDRSLDAPIVAASTVAYKYVETGNLSASTITARTRTSKELH